MWDAQQRDPARPQNTEQFGQRPAVVRYVFEHMRAVHVIEAVVSKGQALDIYPEVNSCWIEIRGVVVELLKRTEQVGHVRLGSEVKNLPAPVRRREVVEKEFGQAIPFERTTPRADRTHTSYAACLERAEAMSPIPAQLAENPCGQTSLRCGLLRARVEVINGCL